MDRIILFDIDGTLFDRKKYLDDFYKLLLSEFNLNESEVNEIKNYYEDLKNEFGFFPPFEFLERIYINNPKLKDKLNFYFSSENLNNYLFEDSEILFDVENVRIGIFSKGDIQFQKNKVSRFEEVLEEDLIYIFHNKIKNLSEVIAYHKDSQIFIVDDNLEVLLSVKDIDRNVKTFLIDRENKFSKVNCIDFKTNSLSDIISVLNE